MLFASVNVTVVRGDTVRLRFTVTDQDGVAADITGTTPSMSLRDMETREIVAQTPSDMTATLTAPVAGLFEVVLPSGTTEPLRGVYAYQAQLTDLSDNRQTVTIGVINFVEPGTPAP